MVSVTPPPARKAPKNSNTAAIRMACFTVSTLLPTDVPIALATSLAPTPYAEKNPRKIAEMRINGIPNKVNSTIPIYRT